MHDDFHVRSVAEIVCVMICFLYAKQCFPTTEVIRRIRDLLNDETEAKRYFSLRSGFDAKLKNASQVLKAWEEQCVQLRSLGDDPVAREKLANMREACDMLRQTILELTNLHVNRDEKVEEFVPRFFEMGVSEPSLQRFYEHIRSKSISCAVRCDKNYRWRFNITRKAQWHVIKCMPAVILISEYESFLLETSCYGKLHWVFDRVKAVLLKYNNRTSDISKYSNVNRTRKAADTINDDDEVDDPTWGMNKPQKKEKIGPPIKSKRKFGQDPPLRSEPLFSNDAEASIPSEYVTWKSRNMSREVLAFFDVVQGEKFRESFTVDDLKYISDDDLERLFTHFKKISSDVIQVQNGQFRFVSIANCICLGAFLQALHNRDPLTLSQTLKKLLHNVEWEMEPSIETCTFSHFSKLKTNFISDGTFHPFENDNVPMILLDSIAYKFILHGDLTDRKETAFQNIFSDHTVFSCSEDKRFSREILAHRSERDHRDGRFYYRFSTMTLRFYLEHLGEFETWESCLFCNTDKVTRCETWVVDPELYTTSVPSKVMRKNKERQDNCVTNVLCECGSKGLDEDSSVVCSCCMTLFRFPEAKNCDVFDSWLKQSRVSIEIGLSKFFVDVPQQKDSETKFSGLVLENVSVDSRKLSPSLVRLISYKYDYRGIAVHSEGISKRREVPLCRDKFCLHDHIGCPWLKKVSDCACEKFCEFKKNFFECPQCSTFYSVFGCSSASEKCDWSRIFSLCFPFLVLLVPYLRRAPLLCLKNFSKPKGTDDEILSDRLWKYMFKSCRDIFYAEQMSFTLEDRDLFLPWRNKGRNVMDLFNGCTFKRTLSTFRYPRILILLAGAIMKSFFNVCLSCVRACGLAVDMHLENRTLLQHEHTEFTYDCALCYEIWKRSFQAKAAKSTKKLPCVFGHTQFKMDCYGCRQIYAMYNEGPVGSSLPQLSPFLWTDDMKNLQNEHASMRVVGCGCEPLFCIDSLNARSQLFRCGATNVDRDFRELVREVQHFEPEKRSRDERTVDDYERPCCQLQDYQLRIWMEACKEVNSEMYVAVHEKLFSEGCSVEEVYRQYPHVVTIRMGLMSLNFFFDAVKNSVLRVRKHLRAHQWAAGVFCSHSRKFSIASDVLPEIEEHREPIRKTRRVDDPCLPDESCTNAVVSKNKCFNPLRSAWPKYQPECGGIPEKFIPTCFRIVKLILAFVGFDQFAETAPHIAFYGRFCALNQFNIFDRILPGFVLPFGATPIWIRGVDGGNDYRNYDQTRKVDLTEARHFYRGCADLYGKATVLSSNFRMHRIMYMAEKAYSRFCTEELEMLIHPKRNDHFSTNIKCFLSEQTDTSENQTDVLTRVVVSLESKDPLFYHFDHSVLQEKESIRNANWDANFPTVVMPPEPRISDRWDAGFPAQQECYSTKLENFYQAEQNAQGKRFWVVKYKPEVREKLAAEDEEVLKDVVRHMQIEFSDDLDEQVGLIENYYKWVLSLRSRSEELKMSEEEVKEKIRKMILLIHEDKINSWPISQEAKATFSKACKVFIAKHKGMGGFLRTLRT